MVCDMGGNAGITVNSIMKWKSTVENNSSIRGQPVQHLDIEQLRVGTWGGRKSPPRFATS